jgi:hypothetical protein
VGNFDGRYQMISRLGAGGMGEVWLAHDEQLSNRPVAIKIMRAQLVPGGEDAARFDREMRLAAQMQHPNIVTLFTTGTFDGAPYMVMEYLEGHDLSKVPPANGVQQVVAIGRETCAALAYAHERDVIHRDIKPGNLFLCDTGQTKVTDFGIAKAMTGTKLSSSGVLVGTFAYMAPEQWLGEPAAFSNDIWALGCVLYEFLSGRLPRECATAGEYAAAAVRREPIPNLRSIASVPDWLGGAVMAMLDSDPGNRPAAAQCVQLLSGVPGGPVTGPVPGAWSAGPATSASSRRPGGAGTTASAWPNGPATSPTYAAQAGGGQPPVNGQPPVKKRGKKGRVIASLVGVAVLAIAGLYAARGAIFGSSAAGASTAAGTSATGSSAAGASTGSPAGSGRSGSPSASASNAAGAIAGSSAAAAGTATLTGSTTQVAVGSAPSFTYTAQGVGSGDSVVLQRTIGQVYQNVATLSGANGPVTAPALNAMGKYLFRVANESDDTPVATSAPVTVEAYGNVPLLPFNNSNGTVQVGNRLFTYTDSEVSSQYPQYEQNQAWSSSTCRSITVQFAEDSSGQQNNGIGYLEFVQTSSDPAYASAPTGTVKSVTVQLDGGPLYINTSSSTGNGIDFTATGSCYTPSGQPQGS